MVWIRGLFVIGEIDRNICLWFYSGVNSFGGYIVLFGVLVENVYIIYCKNVLNIKKEIKVLIFVYYDFLWEFGWGSFNYIGFKYVRIIFIFVCIKFIFKLILIW